MSKMKDMTGLKFGRLTVLSRAENSAAGKARWLCQCECGNLTTVIGTHLRLGKIVSCGCYARENTSQLQLNDLTGQRFGKLVVLERILGNKNKNIYWKCQCDCGTIVNVAGNALASGHTKSCGCLKSYGEELISKILLNHQVNFQKAYSFNDCCVIPGHPLKFDFAIFNENKELQYLIEYDGQQHFISANCGWNNQDYLQEVHMRDLIKNQYCFIHHIPLIRIPYTIQPKITYKDLDLTTTQYLLTIDTEQKYYQFIEI